jgi:uncharacterized phage-associated protein
MSAEHIPSHHEIKFKLNTQKRLEAILWLVNQGDNKLTKYYLLKMIYYAEKYHLNHYGRPVIGDELSAMPKGPVPSHTYNLFKAVLDGSVQTDFIFKSDERTVHANRSADKEFLSKTDIKALEYGFNKCIKYDYPALQEMAHKENDYIKAWSERGLKDSNPIDLKDTIDPTTQTKDSKFLVHLSKYIKV